MSIAPAQANAFVTEILATKAVWAIRDSGGFPTATNASGEKVMPFWSAEGRARRVIKRVAAYHHFEPMRLDLDLFVDRWLAGLERDGLLVGLNWSGERATGYDISPADVRALLSKRF